MAIHLGKGKKDRFVPIGKRALVWVEKYVVQSRPFLGAIQDKDALFVGKLMFASGTISIKGWNQRLIPVPVPSAPKSLKKSDGNGLLASWK